MAVITPTNLRVSPEVAHAGDTITFTWEWDQNPVDTAESISGKRKFWFETLDPTGTLEFLNKHTAVADLVNPSYSIEYGGYIAPPYYVEYRITATNFDNSDDLLGPPSDTVRVYDSSKPEEPTPDTPTPAAGRLEQFQNSEGTNIYPKTVLEGVFRQRDGKKLEEILEETGGVTMEQVNAAIQQAVLDSWEGNY